MVAYEQSGLAIASLVLGIVGICTWGISGIVGLILGIVAKKQIDASGGILQGRRYAKAGIIISSISIALFVGAIIIMLIIEYVWGN